MTALLPRSPTSPKVLQKSSLRTHQSRPSSSQRSFLPFDLPAHLYDAFDLGPKPSSSQKQNQKPRKSSKSSQDRPRSQDKLGFDQLVDHLNKAKKYEVYESFTPFGGKISSIGKKKEKKHGAEASMKDKPSSPAAPYGFFNAKPVAGREMRSDVEQEVVVIHAAPKRIARIPPPSLPSPISVLSPTPYSHDHYSLTTPLDSHPDNDRHNDYSAPTRETYALKRVPTDTDEISALEQLSSHLLAEANISGFRRYEKYENDSCETSGVDKTRAVPRQRRDSNSSVMLLGNTPQREYVMVDHPSYSSLSQSIKSNKTPSGKSKKQYEGYMKTSDILRLAQQDEHQNTQEEMEKGGKDLHGGLEKSRLSSQSASLRGWRKLRPGSFGGDMKKSPRPLSDTLKSNTFASTTSQSLFLGELPPVPSITGKKGMTNVLEKSLSRIRSTSSSQHGHGQSYSSTSQLGQSYLSERTEIRRDISEGHRSGTTPHFMMSEASFKSSSGSNDAPPIPPRAAGRPVAPSRSSSNQSGSNDAYGGKTSTILPPRTRVEPQFNTSKLPVPFQLGPLPSPPHASINPSLPHLVRGDQQGNNDTSTKDLAGTISSKTKVLNKFRIKRPSTATGLKFPVDHSDIAKTPKEEELDPIAVEGMKLLDSLRPKLQPRDTPARHLQPPSSAHRRERSDAAMSPFDFLRMEKKVGQKHAISNDENGLSAMSFLMIDDPVHIPIPAIPPKNQQRRGTVDTQDSQSGYRRFVHDRSESGSTLPNHIIPPVERNKIGLRKASNVKGGYSSDSEGEEELNIEENTRNDVPMKAKDYMRSQAVLITREFTVNSPTPLSPPPRKARPQRSVNITPTPFGQLHITPPLSGETERRYQKHDHADEVSEGATFFRDPGSPIQGVDQRDIQGNVAVQVTEGPRTDRQGEDEGNDDERPIASRAEIADLVKHHGNSSVQEHRQWN